MVSEENANALGIMFLTKNTRSSYKRSQPTKLIIHFYPLHSSQFFSIVPHSDGPIMMKQNMGSTVIISNQNDTCLSLRFSINFRVFVYGRRVSKEPHIFRMVKVYKIEVNCFKGLWLFIYLFLLQNACVRNPCKNNSTCRSDFTGKGYICLCSTGFKGPTCQEGKTRFQY